MAAYQPSPGPGDDEVARIVAGTDGLLEDLQDFDRRFAAGVVTEGEFVSHEEARRRLGFDASGAS